ncbi:MAG TPA: DUF4824 family protein [Chiayiivirga sp.]|nr:DUF4824 family protein [Chiayiivirga sp.]
MSRAMRSRRLFLAGAALIIAVNAVILAGAVWNRSAEEARMTLTQRELPPGWNHGLEQERSAISLQLAWRVMSHEVGEAPPHPHYSREVDWLDLPRLRALGFDLPDAAPARSDEARRRRIDGDRGAWLVLELDGAAHAAAVEAARRHMEHAQAQADAATDATRAEFANRAKAAREALDAEREERSRLFVIDAGTDPAALRSRYPQRDRYLILGGRVGVTVQTWADGETLDPPRYRAHVTALDVESLHVPARFHDAIATAGNRGAARYRLDVAWGRRHEPWLIAAQRGSPSAGDSN